MSIEDRVRAELRAEANRMTVPPGSIENVQVRGLTKRRHRTAAAVGVAVVSVVVAVGVGAFLRSGAPVDIPIADRVTAPTQPQPETTLPPTTTLPTTSAAVAPRPANRIVLATQEGVVAVEDGEVIDRIDIGPVMAAFDDLADGYVVQIGMSASSILRLADPDDDLDEVVAPGVNETLTLRDVVVIDGAPTIVYTARLSGVAPEEAQENLRIRDLASGEDRLVAQVGGYESGASQVTYAAGVFVVTMNAEGYTWFEAYALDGTPVPFDGNPRTEEDSAEDFLIWVGVGSLAPDGETFAFVEGSPRSEAPFRLVIVDLPTGDRLWEADVLDMARDDTLTRLEWDGETALVSIAGERAVTVRDGSVVNRAPTVGTADLVSRP